MSDLASLRERLHKFKMERRQQEKTETTLDQTQDSTGNTTDHRSWMKRIESQGNRAEDWLLYTNFLVQNMQGAPENTSYDYICNTYSKAIRAISSSGGHKCEAYARLFVNYANFMSQRDIDDARELFYSARTNLSDYAIVHIYAAQFELTQDNIDKCRKIFEKAKDMKVEPRALLEAAHLNFLLGYPEFVNEEQIAKHTGTPIADQPDGKPSKFDTSRDSGISICSGRSDTTRNLTDRDFKDSSSLYHDMSKRTFSTRGGSSSDDSLPLSTSLSNHAFSKPLVPKVSGTAKKMPGLIKSAPVKRDLVSNDCEAQESPVPSAYGSRNRQSMWNNAFLPDHFVQSEEEGTVSFNIAEKGRAVGKRVGSGGTSEDTVPLSLESSECQYNRPLRTSHSTPDCKNASTLSMASSRKKRFVGKARRMLPQVEESSTTEERQMDGLSLPIMPDFDVSRTQDFYGADSLLGVNNVSASTTLTTSHSGQSTLVKTPTTNTRPSEDCPQEEVPMPKRSEIIITAPSPPPRPQSPQTAPPAKPQLQVQKPEPMHIETPVKSNVVPAVPVPSQHCPAPEPAQLPPEPTPPPPPAQSTVLPPQLKPTAKQEVLVINKKAYTVLNCIGQGGSSSVFEVFDADHNLRAVKIVNMTGADEPTIKSFKNEIALLQRLQTSDRVITMYDHEFNVRTNLLYVVMERGDPDLATFFSRNKKLNDIQMLYFWQEMLEAVQVLHQEGIVHTDLKPANFMIVGGHLKLIDFGIAKAIQQDMTSVTTDQQVGTLNFMSPEALMADSYGSEEDENGQVQRKHKIGYKSDVWSLGCILYRMVYGRTPFQTIRNQLQKMRAIINPSNEIKFPPIPDAKLHDVLQKCLIRDPRTRPTIDELLEHPYLRKTDEPEPPAASTHTNETILRLMEQMATASPTSFSACKQSVQGLLEQLMGPRPAQAAGTTVDTKMDLVKEGAAARSSQRTPLSSLNPPLNNK